MASRNLKDLAELDVQAKQCQRVAIRIGDERLAEQTEQIEEYEQATLPQQQHGQGEHAPANDWSGRVAVIQADGGRTQIRDEYWGQEKPGDKKHRWWRETQCGVLQTYQSKPSEQDPHPDVPEALTDPLWAIPKFNEIHRQHTSPESEAADESNEGGDAGSEDVLPCDETQGETDALPPPDGADPQASSERWSGGPPLVKTVVATRQGYDHLGKIMAAEAYQRGFNKAPSKAFLGDGLKVNWSLWKRCFSHYTPIADLMHALSYVYAAAVAASPTMEAGWSLYLVWLRWTWQGEVQQVIAALQSIAASQTTSIEAVDRAITYLSNNAARMHYAEYRRAGLPITTSLVESTQKQINRRIKGTEKFWEDEHLEPLLQLITDDLSETEAPDAFWTRRRQRFQGFRQRRAKT